ncbi:MAG: SRPBCC domain-containing protein [bacterium]|nr:SRPBCC domain-containing protein [bacterium]
MKTVIKTYTIASTPEDVFKALTEVPLIEAWSGSEATMDLNTGGEFSLWGGDIHGINKKISPDQIIQDWKESTWPEYSLCTFNISREGSNTKLELIHENVPDQSANSIDGGWDDYYLGPLKELLENKINN